MRAPDVLLYDYPASICCQMTRLTLAEKGVAYTRKTIDIMDRAEQFEPWYTALNPKAVVPTLRIDDEIVTDTMVIIPRIDRQFDGPPLTPAAAGEAEAMRSLMRGVMAIHYGVLLYGRRLDADGASRTVVERGIFLRNERDKHPERAELLDPRIAGNERMQKVLADPAALERHIGEARSVVDRIDASLGGGDFVCGSRYTLADALATAALARFHLHGLQHWWSGGTNASVAAYCDRMRARPSWSAAGIVDGGDERAI